MSSYVEINILHCPGNLIIFNTSSSFQINQHSFVYMLSTKRIFTFASGSISTRESNNSKFSKVNIKVLTQIVENFSEADRTCLRVGMVWIRIKHGSWVIDQSYPRPAENVVIQHEHELIFCFLCDPFTNFLCNIPCSSSIAPLVLPAVVA